MTSFLKFVFSIAQKPQLKKMQIEFKFIARRTVSIAASQGYDVPTYEILNC